MTATELIDQAVLSQSIPETAQAYAQMSIAQSLIDLTDQVADVLSQLESLNSNLDAIGRK